jgi:hypothetical protein
VTRARALLLLALVVGACAQPVTEVVVLVNSDLYAMGAVNIIGIDVTPTVEGLPAGVLRQTITSLPATLGVQASGGSSGTFDVSVQLFMSSSFGEAPLIVVGRQAFGVSFVPDQTRVLSIELPSACACRGTTCPAPDTPGCEDLQSPPLEPFDTSKLPASTTLGAPLATH